MGQRQVSFDEWVDLLKRNKTDETVKKYLSWGIRFEDWAGDRPDKSDLVAYDEFLRDGDRIHAAKDGDNGATGWAAAHPPKDGYSYASRIQALSAAKSWMAFAYGTDFNGGPEDLINNIVDGEPDAFDPEIADPGKVAEILKETRQCEADSCHAMALLSYDAVMRVSEVVKVRMEDLDLDRGTVYVRAAKGSDNRHIQIAPSTVEVLRDYRELVYERFDDPEYLFYKFYQHEWNHPWSAEAYGSHFRRQHWEAGHHSFARHSAITNRLRNGESLTQVSNRARHSSMRITQKYNQFAASPEEVPPELK